MALFPSSLLSSLALSLALLPCAARAAEPLPTLHWLVQDVPPHFSYMRPGQVPQTVEDIGQGELDGFLRILVRRMPQYRHVLVEMPFTRFELQARQGQTLCSVLHVKTPERLGWLWFSHLYPPLFSRQLHVVVHKDRLAQFETAVTGQPLQLADLLQRQDLVGLLPRDRAFGPRIDALLKQAGDGAPRTVVPNRNMHLLHMLRARRMDFTLEYPSVVDEFLRLNGGDDLVKLPLAEGRSTQLATVACTRSAEGRQQIEAIDAAVRRLAQEKDRDAWLRSWRREPLDEQDRQRVNRYMDERARGGPIIE
ncbi:hypothetical protein [Roseateles flavus]|uniref:Solute-binding protein family 3/N-terminal domain-containing protein n=1 Tax=Roseateles flavus TaxID=3149041 RepID=A0ABV0GJF6_9BURK